MVQCPKLNQWKSTLKPRPKRVIPELRNSNRNADYFYSSAKIFESVASHAVFVYNKLQINRHASADICAAS